MVHDIVKTCVEEHDIKRLKYIFGDCLDVDPLFTEYKDDYEYCINAPGLGLVEPYIELTPLRDDKSSWDIPYWNSIKRDLIKNFSQKRFQHMREVSKVVNANEIKKLSDLQRERLEMEKRKLEQENKKIAEKIERKNCDKPEESKPRSVIQREWLEKEKRKLDQENRKVEEKIERKSYNKSAGDTYGHPNIQSKKTVENDIKQEKKNSEDGLGKKAVGIVVTIVIMVVLLVIVKKMI